ncbi:MAG: hypothetical protein MI749_04610 [Desulfovibrionales bacterium]|nr:hypothetical protein [Desulfovibrionales bacterium]
MFKIDGHEYQIETTGVVGILDDEDGLFWAIDIYGKGQFIDEDNYIEPKLSFIKLPHAESTDRSLAQIHFKNAEAYDENIDDWIGDFYIYDAHFFKSEITLTRVSKSNFHISWKGEVDISYETSTNPQFIPFEIDLEIPFYGILCRYTDENDSKELLQDICDVSEFVWIEDGNEYFDCAFFSTINFSQ